MARLFHFLRIALAAMALAFLDPFALSDVARAQPGGETGEIYTLGALTITGAFARATLPRAPVGGGYLSIANAGSAPDRLVSVSADISTRVTLHQMRVEEGMMTMNEVRDGIEIPARGSVSLAPGGTHIMFMGLKGPLVQGESVPVTLVFETAGEITVALRVEGPGASSPAAHAH